MLDSVWIKLLYLTLTIGLVLMHMEYVHRRHVVYSRAFIYFQLTTDMTGFAATWVMLAHFRPQERWIPWFLGVHAVIHFGSLIWALVHWRSLEQHMRDFQARRLPAAFQAFEFLYEQSDCALYLATSAIVAVTLPAWAMVLGIMTCSTLIAAWRPTAGFAHAPAGGEVVPFRKAA